MMKRMLLPLTLVLTAGCPGPVSPETARVDDILALTAEADADAGAAVYAGRCENCHGADGMGNIGPNMFESMAASDDQTLLTSVVEGIAGMPAAGDLDDQTLADLWAYIAREFG